LKEKGIWEDRGRPKRGGAGIRNISEVWGEKAVKGRVPGR